MRPQFETSGNGLLVRAPAKINLALLVVGKRPDGYHDLKTIMAKVDWYDELLFEMGAPGIELVCQGKHWAPEGRENLVYRAVETLCEKAGTEPAVKVTLTKNIPAGSGLGSASSDAAAALLGMNKFGNPGLGQEDLVHLASSLGSDVPFFLNGPLALCTGRGEKILPILQKFAFSAVLILPGVNTSTKKVYENYRHDNSIYLALNEQIDRFLDGNRLDLLSTMCANMLENSCFQLHPEIARLKTTVEKFGVNKICLSGSGSSLFCLFSERENLAVQSCHRILSEHLECETVIVNSNNW
jgi:4-diphosphocytidyl-2-C-methyl-D-erythritol kinase